MVSPQGVEPRFRRPQRRVLTARRWRPFHFLLQKQSIYHLSKLLQWYYNL